MPAPEKRSDAIEVHWENAITWGFLGLLSLFIGFMFQRYGHNWFRFDEFAGLNIRSLSWPFFAAAPLLFAYAIYRMRSSSREASYTTSCPYCAHETEFTEQPEEDYVCDSCHRRVPVLEGRVLDVTGVRCGSCGALNYMSEKTQVLICEECDREIPLLNPDTGEMRHAPKGFARVDDDALYELLLVDTGKEREALITSLQHMLALNRNQVKKMLEEVPVTLLTGINRRKAEMLKAQIEASEGTAEFRQITSV